MKKETDETLTGTESADKKDKPPEGKKTQETAGEEKEKEVGEETKELDLPTLFIWFISLLSGKTWEYLGLIMNPETKQVNQDLKKAKISIDTIAFLFEQIKGFLSGEDFNRIETLLTNLRMNYVQKLKKE
ncbi:MAG: hypothetical protein Kow00103_11260 [Candidatus Caldatribacteriota bacterium]